MDKEEEICDKIVLRWFEITNATQKLGDDEFFRENYDHFIRFINKGLSTSLRSLNGSFEAAKVLDKWKGTISKIEMYILEKQ